MCLSANYRLAPAVSRREQVADVKRVIAWVRANAAEYSADPTTVFLVGSSAGAQLAMAAALTGNDPAGQPGFEEADTSVLGAVGLYGYYGGLDPSPYGGSGEPAYLVVHGALDSYVFVEGAREFARDLRRATAGPVVYAELPGGQHSFDLFHSVRFESVVDAVEAFAAWVRSRDRSA